MLNRYERQNAAHKIDGYYTPPGICPGQAKSVEEAFDSAHKEAIKHAGKALQDLREITMQEFLAGRQGK